MAKSSLLLSCLGAAVVALSTHLGGVSGFVGMIVWTRLWWRLANAIGWFLLIGGFLLQYLSACRAARCARPPREMEALVNMLERKGILTQGEVLEELARMRRPL